MSPTMSPGMVRLDEADRVLVRELAARCVQTDAVGPLNESARLALDGAAAGPHTHWLAREEGELIGYAQWDAREQTVQLMVDPAHRRRGVGLFLASGIEAPDSASWWAFGDLPAARALAARLGLRPARSLLIMRMAMPPVGPHDAALPTGLTLDHYRDSDLAGLVAVNHAAFAHHPEQGAMTAQDARARMSQDWFDPAGLLVARDSAGSLVGFHWTKVDRHGGAPRGEVYVLAVDPAHERRGVGRALLDAGIVHMRARDVDAIDLYVEAANPRVVDIYRRSGFSVVSTDTAYAGQERSDE